MKTNQTLAMMLLSALTVSSQVVAAPRQNKVVPPTAQTVILSDIRLMNVENVPAKAILDIIELQRGSRFKQADTPKIVQKLIDSGLFKAAQVELNNDILLLTLEEQPLIDSIEIEGAKSIKSKSILNNFKENNVAAGKIINPNIVGALIQAVKQEYHSIGKENVKINVDLKPIGDKVKIFVKIDEGETSYIKEIIFIGNKHFSANELKRKINISERNALNGFFTNTRFNENTIKADIEKLILFYRNQGYADVKIDDVKISNLSQDAKKIVISIHEGEKYQFDKPNFIIDEYTRSALSDTELEKLNLIKAGKQFSHKELNQTQNNVYNHLTKNGYPYAQVEVRYKDNDNRFQPDILVKANQKATINKITVSGTEKTNKQTVLKELRMKAGDVFNSEKIDITVKKLNQTGFYEFVEIATVPVSENMVDLNIVVKERRTGSATASIGYDQSSGLVIGGEIRDKNAFGKGKEMALAVSHGKTDKSITASYVDPHLFGQDKSLQIDLYGNREKPEKNAYKTKRYGSTATFGLPLNDWNKIYFGLGVEKMRLDLNKAAPYEYQRFVKNYGKNNSFNGVIAKGLVSWEQNTTSDAYWGYSGSKSGVYAEATLPFSKVKYVKAQAEHSHYFPVSESMTLKVQGQAGWGRRLGKQKNMPFFENFQAGGISNVPVRGFEVNSLGEKEIAKDGSIMYLGGNKMAAASIELMGKIPYTKDSNNMRVSAFVDSASVWNKSSNFKKEFRASAGVALTWYSPIGALKISYAKPLKKGKHDEKQAFQFTLGTVF